MKVGDDLRPSALGRSEQEVFLARYVSEEGTRRNADLFCDRLGGDVVETLRREHPQGGELDVGAQRIALPFAQRNRCAGLGLTGFLLREGHAYMIATVNLNVTVVLSVVVTAVIPFRAARIACRRVRAGTAAATAARSLG